MKKTTLRRLILLLCFAVLILLTWWLSTLITPQDLQAALTGLDQWAIPAYIGLWVILPAFFFPVVILALAGGLLFGLFWGSLYTFIGAVLNCSLMFWMARSFGQKQIRQLVEQKLSLQWQQRLSTAGGKQGFLLLIILRLIPAVPYNLINYTFGLTNMSFASYLLASAIGIIPGTMAFINIGDKALDVASPSFWLAIGLMILLLVVTTLLGKQLFPSESQMNNKENENNGKEKT
ncbi:MAG: TVP38/TMEM64 family protein [Oscillospiraceae bacterium]|nr:TVP38/TMEM64 family protein [Oscillospiraceae bacterium]